MSASAVNAVLDEVRRLTASWDHDTPDRVLLERFHGRQDHGAFALLIRRHGPMVLGLAYRLLGDSHAAEDVFQAVFLVLARQAGSIRQSDAVSGWLSRIAWRLACRVRRSRPKTGASITPEPATTECPLRDASRRELNQAVDEEIQRLPEKFHSPIVLCYLEGLTQDQAAARLGWSKAMLRRRLDRARDLLRARLAGRGADLALPGIGALPSLTTTSVDSLASASVNFATGRFAAGTSGTAVALAEDLLRATLLHKMRGIGVGVCLALLVAGGVLAQQARRLVPANPQRLAAAEGDAGTPEQATKPDSLEGTWKVEEAEAAGKHLAQDVSTEQVWTITKDRIVIQYPGGERHEWTYKASKTAAPHTIDMKQVAGRLSGREGSGIWEQKGDTLRMCYASPAEGRPTAFDLNGKDTRSGRLFVLQRLRQPQDKPAGAVFRLGRSALAHQDSISCLAYSPDGKILASGGHDGCVRLWNPTSGDELKSLRHFGWVRSLVFAPDGKALYSCSDGEGIRLWDVATGKELRRFGGEQGMYTALALTRDGKKLACCVGEKTVIVFDTQTGQQHLRWQADERAYRVAFSPDGKTLVMGGEAKKIRRWDTATGKELPALEGHGGSTYPVAFSPDGKQIASGGSYLDGRIHLWDAATGKELRRWAGQPHSALYALTFSPEGKTLFAAHSGARRELVAWDVATGKEVRSYPTPSYPLVDSIAVSPDGKQLASAGCWGRGVYLWDVQTAKETSSFARHHDGITSITYNRDGNYLLTASADCTVGLWGAKSGKLLGRFGDHRGPVGTVGVSPDGRLAASAAAAEKVVRLWSIDSQKAVRELSGATSGFVCLAFSPDGKTLAAGQGSNGIMVSGARQPDRPVYLWDVSTGKAIRQIHGRGGRVNAVAFSPDGETLASTGVDDKYIHFWDPKTGKEQVRLVQQTESGAAKWYFEGTGALAFSPDGRTLAALSFYENKKNMGPSHPPREGLVRTVSLWEVASGKPRQEIRLRRNSVTSLAFVDARHLVLGCRDGSLRPFDLATGQWLPVAHGHKGAVTSLAVSPDGRTFASASLDTTSLLWRSATPGSGKARKYAARSIRDGEALRAVLLGTDAPKSYRAGWELSAMPEAVDLLEGLVAPVPRVDAAQIKRLVARLDSDSFAEREKATAELQIFRELAEPMLRDAMRQGPSAEVRRRVGGLLSRLDSPEEKVRTARVLEVLERLWTPRAAGALEKVAGGVPRARLTRDAKAALDRLRKRPAAR